MLNVICVRVGDKYGPEYVERLRSMVERHLDRECRFTALGGGEHVLGLRGWWAKLLLFDGRASWRNVEPALYLDLDTVIVGDLGPLADAAERTLGLGICANFTRAGAPDYPCRFGSCVMTLAPGWGGYVWEAFESRRWALQERHQVEWPFGDQQAIEELVRPEDVTLLQDVLPAGYLCSYRDLTADGPPEGAAVINFGGASKPHNSPHAWVKDAWR